MHLKSIDGSIVYFDLLFPYIDEYDDDYDFATETFHKDKDNVIV